MHLILKYCKSHIYDIHALLVGTIIFVLYLVWKDFIDALIMKRVNKRYQYLNEEHQMVHIRRMWGLIYVLIFILAFLFFCAVSFISPFVEYSVPASIISATFAITELEFYKSFFQDRR